jgi:leucine dehydrogenase
VYGEIAGWDPQRSLRKADEIYNTTLGVYELAKLDKIPTYRAADRLAEKRLKAVGALVRTWPEWPNK